jgi:hypothetical protein
VCRVSYKQHCHKQLTKRSTGRITSGFVFAKGKGVKTKPTYAAVNMGVIFHSDLCKVADSVDVNIVAMIGCN